MSPVRQAPGRGWPKLSGGARDGWAGLHLFVTEVRVRMCWLKGMLDKLTIVRHSPCCSKGDRAREGSTQATRSALGDRSDATDDRTASRTVHACLLIDSRLHFGCREQSSGKKVQCDGIDQIFSAARPGSCR